MNKKSVYKEIGFRRKRNSICNSYWILALPIDKHYGFYVCKVMCKAFADDERTWDMKIKELKKNLERFLGSITSFCSVMRSFVVGQVKTKW